MIQSINCTWYYPLHIGKVLRKYNPTICDVSYNTMYCKNEIVQTLTPAPTNWPQKGCN